MLSIDVARALSVSRPRPRSWSPPPAPHMEEDSVLGRVVATAREAGVLAGLEGGGLALFTTERGSVVLGLLANGTGRPRCWARIARKSVPRSSSTASSGWRGAERRGVPPTTVKFGPLTGRRGIT